MKIKGKMTLLSFLACASLLSVGFSAWTVHGGDEENINGTIYIDGLETKTYVSATLAENYTYNIEDYILEYKDPSLVGPDSYSVRHNRMKRTYNINIKSCLNDFPHTESIDLIIRLSYSDVVMEKLKKLEKDGVISSASNYYDFFHDSNLESWHDIYSYEFEEVENNLYLAERKALLANGISQFTFPIYKKDTSVYDTKYNLTYVSLLEKFEEPKNNYQNACNELHAKYFGWDVLETSPLLFDVGDNPRFKFEATLVIKTGGES